MDRSLLLESSFIFDNSTLVDRIRQSLIDINLDPPTEEDSGEVQNLVNESLQYLDKDLPLDTAIDLMSLISNCFKQFPTFLSSQFANFFKTAKLNANHIVLTARILASLTHVDPPLSLPDYHSFVDDSIKQIQDQLKNTERTNLKLFDHEIPAILEMELIVNLLISSTLTKELLSSFSQIFLSPNFLSLPRDQISVLVKDAAKSGLLEFIPEKLYTNSTFLSILTADEIQSLLTGIKTETFSGIRKKLEELCIKFKIPSLTIEFLKKCKQANQKPNEIYKLLETLSYSDITPELWEFLKTIKLFQLPAKIANEITEFPDPVFAFRIMPNPFRLPPEVLTRALLETPNVHDYIAAIGNEDIPPNDVFKSTEFWLHLTSIMQNESLLYCERFGRKIAQCLRDLPEDKVIEILDAMIMKEYPPKDCVCMFVSSILKNASNEVITAFISKQHTEKIFGNLKVIPCHQFWNLVLRPRKFHTFVHDHQTPYLQLGYLVLLLHSQRPSQLHKYEIQPQTHESLNQVFEYMANPPGRPLNIKPDISEAALSLITSSMLLSLDSVFGGPPEPCEIIGLTKESILPFYDIGGKFIKSFDQNDSQARYFSTVFRNAEILDLLYKALDDIIDNDAPIVTESIHVFLDLLANRAMIELPEMRRILDKMIEFMLSGRFTKENQVLFDLIFNLSRNSNRNTRGLFDKFGMTLFEFLYKNNKDITSKPNGFQYQQRNATLNLSLFDKEKVAAFVTQAIQNSEQEEMVSGIRFFVEKCSSQPKLQPSNIEKILAAIRSLIQKENWNDLSVVCNFLIMNDQKNALKEFINQPIQHSIKVQLMQEIPIEEVTIDNLLSILLTDPQPGRDNSLYHLMYNRLMTDPTIVGDQITTLLERIHGRFCFTAKLVLDLFQNEYKSYNTLFLKALDKMYVMPPDEQTLILRPDFQVITKPISPFGLDLVNRLLKSQEENPNYQSYYYLKCLAHSFLFLFTDNPQQIFTTVLKSLEHFEIILEDEKPPIGLNGLPANENSSLENTAPENSPNAESNQTNGDNATAGQNNTDEVARKAVIEEQNKAINQENREKEKQSKIVAGAITFLHSTLFSPIIFDAFVKWFFENIETFNNAQVFAFLLVFRSLYSTKSIQHVLAAVFMKNQLPEIITQLLERKVEGGPLKVNYLLSLYRITASYYRSLNSFTAETITSIDELQQIENPFQVTFDHCIMIHPTEGRTISPLDLIDLTQESATCYLANIRDFVKVMQESRVRIRALDLPPRAVDEFIAEYRKHASVPQIYNEPLPESVNREAFQLLSMKLQSTILHLSLPQIPRPFTPAMHRYLATRPSWISMWLEKNYQLLLLPEHYAVLMEVLKDLANLQQADPEADETFLEDQLLLNFCQGQLFEDLINQAASASPKDRSIQSLYTVFGEISKDGAALISLLQYISSRIESAYKEMQDVKDLSLVEEAELKERLILNHLLRILLMMCKTDGFKENFPDICGDTVLDIVCSPKNREHTSILVGAAKLYSSLGDKMPNRIVHLICFMFMSKKKKIIPAALDLCAKLNDQTREDIMNYVQEAFDRAINSYDPVHGAVDINEFLKRFPIVANTRQLQLLKLLKQLLQDIDKRTPESIDLLGSLFNVLAPHRGRSQSIRLSDSVNVDPLHPRQSLSTIPGPLYDQAPAFWDLFQEYRKQINDIIRNDPEKLRTTFKFLLEYPELTDFSIRVAFFHEQMKRKIHPGRGQLELTVRRSDVLQDSYLKFHGRKPDDLLTPIHVKFIGEQGVDAGGVKRDWFTNLVKEIFNPNYALFIPSSNKRSSQPNPLSFINKDHMAYFKFAGQVIARALIEGINVDAHLTTSFCKQILQAPVTLRDLEDVDESLHQSLEWILKNDIDKPEFDPDLYFTVDEDYLGGIKTLNLKPNGINIKVSNENKEEYVTLMVEHRLKNAIAPQVKSFCEGFNSLIAHDDIKRFSPNELDLLICGIPEIDVEDFKKNTEYQFPYTAESPVIKFFFDAVSKWDNENLAKLLLFITGSSQVPISGFKSFKDSGQPITIAPGGGKERLPAAHTCFNRIDLPEYDNEEDLNQKLMFAIQECNTFGFI